MKKLFKNLSYVLFVGLLLSLVVSSCKKTEDNISPDNPVPKVLMDGDVNLLDPGRYGVPEFDAAYLASIHAVSPEEYKKRLSEFRPELANNTQAKANAESAIASSMNLPTPPVGNQGNEGSCVGWGVGYAAHSITRFINNTVHNSNWNGARRSAAYIYNQIKGGDCAAGSFPDAAMNLVKNQGECSELQMPYVSGQCYVMPSQQQRTWAAARKSGAWFNVTANRPNDIKYYLSQNYPVAVCFDVNSSFQNISSNNYVWSQLYGSRIGGHCVCIVGYDDATQQFKVQNSWGASWGRSGYFYVTYANVTNGAFNWMGCMMPNPNANTPQ